MRKNENPHDRGNTFDVEVGQSKDDDGIDMENIISSARICREIVQEYFMRTIQNFFLSFSFFLHKSI